MVRPNGYSCWLLLAAVLTIGPRPSVVAEEPSRWESAIAAFERQDESNPPPQNGILFLGSSSIRLWDVAKHFPDRPVFNRGFGGSEIADSIAFASRIVLPYRPRIVVLYAGDNDIARGKTPKEVFADYTTFVRTVHETLPQTRIVYIAIKPSLKRWEMVETMRAANRMIQQATQKDDRLDFVDIDAPMLGADGTPRPELFVDDGLHLSESGYALWSSLLTPHFD